MSNQTTALPVHAATHAVSPTTRSGEKAFTSFTYALLVLAGVVLIALACACAWLSYRAQVDYVLAHNGEQASLARVWAVLLDTGTVGLSLLRLDETVRARPGTATRLSLVGCIAVSVTMNLLHSPSQTVGGYVVAAVPPIMYATFLEHLLAMLRSLLIPEEAQRGLVRSIALWINFPCTMWSAWRTSLRAAVSADVVARAGDAAQTALPTDASVVSCVEAAQYEDGSSRGADVERASTSARRGRGLGAKRQAFETALAAQVRCGDLRLFSADRRERNEAAYQAAESLPAPLSRGAARRYVVQALPRLTESAPAQSQ